MARVGSKPPPPASPSSPGLRAPERVDVLTRHLTDEVARARWSQFVGTRYAAMLTPTYTRGSNRVGEIIAGKYELLGELGKGGMASVFVAEHLTLRRLCALKLNRPDLGEFAEVVAEEGSMMARVAHPNVLGVHDAAEHQGSMVTVTNLVRGRSLQDLVERPVPLDLALEVAIQLCEALAALHAAGVVHRDVKPGNVLLAREASALRVVLVDFGLAMPVHAKRQRGSGTAEYMPPEQWRPNASADPRSDLYALGISLYEILAGMLPFDGETDAELARLHATVVPPPLNVHPALDAIVAKLLAKDPCDRYPTAQALQRNLEAVQRSLLAPAAAVPGS